MKYLWAAYRSGDMKSLHEIFDNDLEKDDFVNALELLISESGWHVWTLVAETSRGVEPIGMATGWLLGKTLVMAKGHFFSWASKRNIRESAFHFFDSMRKVVIDEEKDIPDPLRYMVVLQFSPFEHKKFYESMEDHGILRKVGHVLDLGEKPTVMFQTRSPVI